MLPYWSIQVLDGANVPFTQFSYIISGEMADNWSETYKTELEAQAFGGSLATHVVKWNYKHGRFDPYTFTVPLFSGMSSLRGSLDSGLELVKEANALANLAKPDYSGDKFYTPPYCAVRMANLWYARGFFREAKMTSKGSWDDNGHPTYIEMSLTFERHVGPNRIDPALTNDLRKYSSGQYRFLTG